MSTVQGGQGNIVTNGLVLNLDAANPRSYAPPFNGTTWTDLSGNSNNGTLTNGPTFNSGNGGSIVFDGVDDSCNISCNFTGFTGITVNVWYYSNTNSSTALTRSLGNGFIFHFRGAGFYLVDSSNTVSGYLGWNTPPSGFGWIMLTGTWDGITMKLYQNGNKQTTERNFTGTGTLRNMTSINLGYYFNSLQPWTNGNISNFQLYNRALSASEVLQNFNSTRARFGV